ncbi:TPA: bacteriocin, partial [Campylobacter coli]
MLKKISSALILGSLLASSAFAGDFLAKVSNGA